MIFNREAVREQSPTLPLGVGLNGREQSEPAKHWRRSPLHQAIHLSQRLISDRLVQLRDMCARGAKDLIEGLIVQWFVHLKFSRLWMLSV